MNFNMIVLDQVSGEYHFRFYTIRVDQVEGFFSRIDMNKDFSTSHRIVEQQNLK